MDRIESLWKGYSGQLLAFIRRRVDDPAEAEDILQDVFLKMFERIDTLQDAEKLPGWMYRIARNAIVDYYRARRPVQALNAEMPPDLETGESPVREEVASWLTPLIALLPETYREAVWLSEVEGVTHQAVAERLNISLTAAKSRVRRGKVLMKEILTDCCHFEFDQRGRVMDYKRRKDGCALC